MNVKVYTDGACSSNGKENAKAGWAYVILNSDDKIIREVSGSIENGTNNIGELRAIIEAMAYCRNHDFDSIEFFCDSAYCVNGITDWMFNWKKYNWWRNEKQTAELKNRTMWIELDTLVDRKKMKFNKVKGHSDVSWNIYVDKLAVAQTK